MYHPPPASACQPIPPSPQCSERLWLEPNSHMGKREDPLAFYLPLQALGQQVLSTPFGECRKALEHCGGSTPTPGSLCYCLALSLFPKNYKSQSYNLFMSILKNNRFGEKPSGLWKSSIVLPHEGYSKEFLAVQHSLLFFQHLHASTGRVGQWEGFRMLTTPRYISHFH